MKKVLFLMLLVGSVALASALIGKPELLVMDEPTSGLDPVSTNEVKILVKTLAKGGMATPSPLPFPQTPRVLMASA